MKIEIPLSNGYLGDRYSKYAAATEMYDGRPAISFPMTFSDLPKMAKTVAWVLFDDDAIPVTGFSWIHWLGANLSVDDANLAEDASRHADGRFIQGKNSTAGRLIHNTDPLTNQHYNGPTPPDKDHEYTLMAYALDTTLDLENGYWLNEFHRAIEGHVVDQITTTFISRA
ncbi:YbhB/YbcL family Raf kinase inhibitor-like protein [Furfurilactobacillus siliginis]|uniref:Phospholipid-binding protein n=1 Tax=Furfurilactobacillus siliginis TaxID=348151 RepID=A0A0R2LED3_9LACO|nr:YbhB/YbcL family Raf kinase inhibitor-like protein [Furfurilactobacillus siliginis]KRN96887.1 phospholipid-binding protein [Furfurilactobacillus siliginis]GEK28083.1 hypothetical protein LSI01_03940 [Furfurilactobacillus siliginis]